jgi:hypothetical protein
MTAIWIEKKGDGGKNCDGEAVAILSTIPNFYSTDAVIPNL